MLGAARVSHEAGTRGEVDGSAPLNNLNLRPRKALGMDSLIIRGGVPLEGTVDISGSKNASLPILAACLMADGPTRLHGVPRLSDISSMLQLLGSLGCDITRHEPASLGNTGKLDFAGRPALDGPLDIAVTDESNETCHYDLVKTMRASVCVLGPMLAKRGRVKFSVPGGCAIGDRPIDLHLRGLKKLGATFRQDGGYIIGEAPTGGLVGKTLYLGGARGPTVLGTINVMCAAAMANGETKIVGAACEPEVADCADLLNKMGAKITGAGSPQITIEGVERLEGVTHTVIPDRIEAGTFILAAGITGGRLTLRNVRRDHLIAVIDTYEQAGIRLTDDPETGDLIADAPDGFHAVDVTTQPYPGFPTDLQAQFMAAMALADEPSMITERIYPERFTHVAELNRLGAKVQKEGATAMVRGVKRLQGATVMCSDLRASAALLLAGLAASGETRLDRVYHIDRGYEKLEEKLQAVGARIRRVDEIAQARGIVAA
jgi:UDP-N-acetylglucosamine 1-carboxyvinyltransferase